MPEPKTTNPGDERQIENANLVLCTQADLCDAQYALYLAAEDEKDEKKKAALERVQDALHQITNHRGVDGIGNFDLLKEYEAIK
jgi:hypothetical protein